jgi:plasmid stabilization system protein ParE
MSYQVIIQPIAFTEIETAYRWMCDSLNAEAANNWYYELQEAINSLQKFPNRCGIAPESSTIGREIRQLWIGKRRQYQVLFVIEVDVVAILHIRHSRQAYLGEETNP